MRTMAKNTATAVKTWPILLADVDSVEAVTTAFDAMTDI
jgi:hypothetical protein